MASTYSNLKFELIGTGDQSGSWGSTTNINLGTAIEQALVGMATLTSADFTANVATLALSNTNSAQNARALCLVISAASLSAAGTINVPAIQKPYLIINNDSYAVTVKVTALTGVSVPAGKRTVVYNNGTDVGNQIDYLATLALGTALPVTSGGTGTTSTTFVNLATNVTGTLPVVNGGTGVTVSTGTGSVVLSTSPTLITPVLGTPTSATLTNATGLPISTGVSGLGANVATFLATPSSANLAAALTDETGSGANVFATSPTLVTPALGTPSSATLTNATGLPLSTGVTGTLPVANGGTGTVTPSIVAGTNVTVSGTWPNQTIDSSNPGGTVTSVSGTGTVNGISLSGTVTSTGSLTLGGALTGVSLTTQVTGTLPVANGGTGATTLSSGALLKGAGTSAITTASAADIVSQIGSTAVTNATNATKITNSGGWSVTPTGAKLFFNYNGTDVASLDSSGNLITLANITAYGTP